jgi:hypothetical protein
MSRSHVDVYFPHPDVAQAELGHLRLHLPPGTSHRIERVNREVHTHSAPAPVVAGKARTRWDVESPSNATFHEQYHPLHEIESFVRDLAAAYPQQVSIVPLGHSGEGREMFALEIAAAGSSSSETNAGASLSALAPLDGHVSHDPITQVVLGKKGKDGSKNAANTRCGFLITGAQHAREVGDLPTPVPSLGLSGLIAHGLSSGLRLLPHCTSRMPSWPTHPRSFLSRVCLSDMYVCKIGQQEWTTLIRDSELLRCSRSQPRWLHLHVGARPILVRTIAYLRVRGSHYNYMAGTRIVCSWVLKLNVSALT